MLKTTRALILAISVAGLAACQSSVTGPVEQDGYLGSGGQHSPIGAAPSLTDGYLGSGG